MYQYPNSNIFVPSSDVITCPKCHSKCKNIGGCGTGCCDDYECNACKYKFRIEWPD